MAAVKYIVLLFTSSLFYCGLCQLNLSEGSRCVASNATFGTCVSLPKCGTAVLINIYRNAGFKKNIPESPEICSYKNDEPIVCCTDCELSRHDEFKDFAIAPHGILVSRRATLAWKKCLDYFHRLPYPCRGKGDVNLETEWIDEEQCHSAVLHVKLTTGEKIKQKWKFPHLAMLGYGDTVATAQWLCEGSVISERFILTSAHCTNAGVLGTVAYASLGLQNQVPPKAEWQVYGIKRIIKHPDYNEPSWYHDIALLETEREIQFDNKVLPACLHVGILDSSQATAAGTLKKRANETKPPELQSVYLNPQVCTTVYKPDNNLMHGFDPITQLCYAPQKKNEDTCKRLSGSPLQKDQFNCQFTVVGITTRARQCDRRGIPDIYTRVHYYVEWIEGIVWPGEN